MKPAPKLTAFEVAREYRVYLSACHVLWDMSNSWFKAGTMKDNLSDEFKRVSKHLSARREACWQMLVALPLEHFAAAMDATKERAQ